MELIETRVAVRLDSCGDRPAFHINPLPLKDTICFSTHYWTPSIIISDALCVINIYKICLEIICGISEFVFK